MANIDFLHDLLSRAADGAYAVDPEQRILAWNHAAEEILGFRAQDVVGFPCHQILGGQADGGCTVCRRGCRPFTAGQRGELVPSFDVRVRTANGHVRWVNVSIIAVPMDKQQGETPIAVVHLFRDIEAKKQAQSFASEVATLARQLHVQSTGFEDKAEIEAPSALLTRREYQVLTLLSQGADTDAIAKQLVIGSATARNHIQRILHKLNAHSRLEAVTYAREHHLLD